MYLAWQKYKVLIKKLTKSSTSIEFGTGVAPVNSIESDQIFTDKLKQTHAGKRASLQCNKREINYTHTNLPTNIKPNKVKRS